MCKILVLFVQGLHSDYTTWTSGDDFYDAAYNQGYRTAFVQLQDADGSGGSMSTNGQILAGVIKKVANVQGDKKVHNVKDPYVQLSFGFTGGKAGKDKVTAHLSKADKSGRSTKLQDVQMQADGTGGLTSTFVTPSQPGVYNVSFAGRAFFLLTRGNQ